MAAASQSPAEVFDIRLPAELASRPQVARDVNAIYGFRISGEGGGEWTLDLVASPPSCVRGMSGSAQFTIECSSEVFATVLSMPSTVMSLFFTRQLRVSGDAALANKLGKVLILGQS